MSEIKKVKVSQDTLDKKGVATLRTYPSKLGTFGQNGLDAEALKQKFDELPEAIATQFNALCDILIAGNLEEAMAYVRSIDDHEATKEILNLLSVINGVLAYNRKELATQEYTDGKVEDEASARATEDAKKLDTPNNTTGGNKVLVSRWNSAISLWGMSSVPDAGALAMFTDRNTLRTETATDDKDAVPLKQMQDAISAEASERDDAIRTAIADLVNGAPDALDTLKEIADALAKGDSDITASLLSTITAKAEEANRYTDAKAAGKVDKITGLKYEAAYIARPDGTTMPLALGYGPNTGTMAVRDIDGQLRVGTAVMNDAAVPLAQMNTALADKASGADLADLASRVVELEQNGGGGGGGGAPSYTDSAVAYEKIVPANALHVAAITEIGGNTIVFKNPINLAPIMALAGQTITDESGWSALYVTFTEDGRIEYTTDSYSNWAEVEIPIKFRELFPDAELGRAYRIRSKQEYEIWERHYSDGYIRPSGLDTDSFVLTEDILDRAMVVYPTLYEYLNWSDPETGDEEWWTAAADTTFYDIELVPDGRDNDVHYDAKVTQVKVLGVNFLPFTPGERVVGGVTVTTDENGVMTFNGTCTSSQTISTRIAITRGRWYILRDFAEGVWPTSGERIRVGENYTEFTRIYTYNDGSLRKSMARFDKLGAYGQTTIPYIISVKSGHTYENCKLRPMLVQGIVPPTEYVPYTAKSYPIPEEVQSLPAYGLGSPSMPMFYNRIIFRDDRAVYEQRVDTNRQPLSPYVETDITDALGWDGFIEVEGGGAITFANQYEDSVPSTVVYQLK